MFWMFRDVEYISLFNFRGCLLKAMFNMDLGPFIDFLMDFEVCLGTIFTISFIFVWMLISDPKKTYKKHSQRPFKETCLSKELEARKKERTFQECWRTSIEWDSRTARARARKNTVRFRACGKTSDSHTERKNKSARLINYVSTRFEHSNTSCQYLTRTASLRFAALESPCFFNVDRFKSKKTQFSLIFWSPGRIWGSIFEVR